MYWRQTKPCHLSSASKSNFVIAITIAIIFPCRRRLMDHFNTIPHWSAVILTENFGSCPSEDRHDELFCYILVLCYLLTQDMEYVDSTDPSVCCGTCKPKGCYHNNTRYNSGDIIPSDKPCKEMTCVTNNGSPQWFTDKITCTEPRRYCLKVCFTPEKIIPVV